MSHAMLITLAYRLAGPPNAKGLAESEDMENKGFWTAERVLNTRAEVGRAKQTAKIPRRKGHTLLIGDADEQAS